MNCVVLNGHCKQRTVTAGFSFYFWSGKQNGHLNPLQTLAENPVSPSESPLLMFRH